MIWYQIIYGLFCIAFAWLNAYLIKKNRRIYHGLNGMVHISASACGVIFFNWQTGLLILLIARLFFDASLNLWRGLPVDYIPLDPKSKVDKLEKWVFGSDGYTPKIIYTILIIVLNFI